MSTLTAPLDGDRNRAGELDAIAWSWCAVSIVVVGAKLYSRIRITRNMWWDDWFIVITMVPSLNKDAEQHHTERFVNRSSQLASQALGPSWGDITGVDTYSL